MTEYHKIESLYERNKETFKFAEPFILRNPAYDVVKTWHWTEKIDGTNIRITFTPASGGPGEPFYPSSMEIGGRTNNAQLHADLVKWINENVTLEKMKDTFKDASKRVVLYGEGYGAGIQKGGGDYSPVKKFILFDVKVGDWWLTQDNVNDIASKLGIEAVHSHGTDTLENAVDFVRHGFESVLAFRNTRTERPAEGLIGRPAVPLFDQWGHRLIVKLKTKDFA